MNIKEPLKFFWEPFDKGVIGLFISRSWPPCWHYENKKGTEKSTIMLGAERVIYQRTKTVAYRFTLGPINFMIGW